VIKVEGVDPVQLIRRTRHHGLPLIPLVESIVLQITFKLGQDDLVHRIKQHRTGAQSFALHHADGRQFHFRGNAPLGLIEVGDRYRQPNIVASLTDHKSIRNWVATL
jgi:hypothetical protein